MCLATVYAQNEGQEEEVMRDVAWVEPTGSELRLVSLMGESKLLQARIISIDLVNSSIVLQRTGTEPPRSVSPDHES